MSVLEQQPAPSTYRRPTWQEAVVAYLPPERRTPRALQRAEWLPTAVVLLVSALLALRLRNSAFIDEALYLNAGADYLAALRDGAPTPDHGAYFSGAPALYPVLAAVLDSLGGLWLARAFSLLCVLVTIVLVQDTARRLFDSRRTGLLAGAAFGLTGPVLFVGSFATFDALCIALIAAATWGAVARVSLLSAGAVGAALATAMTVKYTAAVFAVPVLALLVLAGRRGIRRLAVAVSVMTGLIAAVLAVHGDSLRPGIEFSTSARSALSPAPSGQLIAYLVVDLGLLVLLAVQGARRGRPVVGSARARQRLRPLLVVTVLLGSAALLPAAQLRLGEAVSFEKHLAYSALFLAPLAGVGLASLSRGVTKFAPALLVLLLVLVTGIARSGSMYEGWPPLDAVVDVIDDDPVPGLYISSASDALEYYTRKDHPDIRWQTTFALYSTGPAGIRKAVQDRSFQFVALRSDSTGSPGQDAGQDVLRKALEASPHYELAVEPFPVRRWSTDLWTIYRLQPAAAGRTSP